MTKILKVKALRKISHIGIPFFPPQEFLEQKEEKKKNEANLWPWSRAFRRRLCVRAPFTNVELEMWMQCYGKLSCEMRYLLQSLLDIFVSSHFSGFAEIAVAWLQRGPQIKTEF